MATVAANPEGRLLAWRHLRAHWSSIQSLFGNATIATGSLVSSIISQFSTQYDCKEVKYDFRAEENLFVFSECSLMFICKRFFVNAILLLLAKCWNPKLGERRIGFHIQINRLFSHETVLIDGLVQYLVKRFIFERTL